MEPLAGWSIAVTAERRADEQAQLLTAQGAKVLATPLVAARACDEAELHRRTKDLIANPPDIVIANTAVGMRSWLALAWSWGLGARLLDMLRGATVVARGTKAVGALLTEDVRASWRSNAETLADVGDHLLAEPVSGKRVALQLDGSLDTTLAARLRDAGADVVELAVYLVETARETAGADRLIAALGNGDVDAVTFTTPAAVRSYTSLAPPSAETLVVCVGPVTAAAAHGAGLDPVVVPGRARLGPMVRATAVALAARSRTLAVAGHALQLQGNALGVGDDVVALTPRERALLEALVDAGGAVVSKTQLAKVAWDDAVDDHAVEVAVNRLRRKLGAASAGLETTNRRGYRLVVGAT